MFVDCQNYAATSIFIFVSLIGIKCKFNAVISVPFVDNIVAETVVIIINICSGSVRIGENDVIACASFNFNICAIVQTNCIIARAGVNCSVVGGVYNFVIVFTGFNQCLIAGVGNNVVACACLDCYILCGVSNDVIVFTCLDACVFTCSRICNYIITVTG